MIIPQAPTALVTALAGAAQQRNLAPAKPTQTVTARPTLPTQKAEASVPVRKRSRDDQEIDEEAANRGRWTDVSV